MINLKANQTVRYFEEPCRIIEVFESVYILESLEFPGTTYRVSRLSRFIEPEDGLKSFFKKSQLVTR